MDNQILFDELIQAYSESNLNHITTRIIKLYRNKNQDALLKLARIVKNATGFDFSGANRVFNQLVLLYHPDRLNFYLKLLEQYKVSKNPDTLKSISHILNIQKALSAQSIDKTPDYRDLYYSQAHYDIDDEDFKNLSYRDAENYEWLNEDSPSAFGDFIEALEQKEYMSGTSAFKLEQLDGELNLSNANIVDLNGIEHCINLTGLDLSNNQIIDITLLGNLFLLESVFLAVNNISDSGILGSLKNLKYIDLSFNDISDIEPLIGLEKLEYLNVIGNRIPTGQIEMLRKKGVVAMY